jgi:hypothetical protein
MRFFLRLTVLIVGLMSGATAVQSAAMIHPVEFSCGSWTAARHNRDQAYEFWVFGFISGIAHAYSDVTVDPFNGMDGKGVRAWVDNYCRAHPIETIADAALAFVNAHPN